MFVEELFRIPETIVSDVKRKPYKFGFNGFGELVYYTNYSRILPSGYQETWIDTCRRVVEGVLSIRKSWYKLHNLKWDEQYWENIAGSLLYYIYILKILPPGRGLWAQGGKYIYERGSMALNNCGATSVSSESFAEDIGWIMDALMCGTGVGVRPIVNNNFKHELTCDTGKFQFFQISDSREGWVDSVVFLINSYKKSDSFCAKFDYSLIRRKGERIVGFGGTASGSEPLIILHNRIREYMKSYINDFIDYGYMRLVANIVNAVGACIIAGNIRRSAELILGSPYDSIFKDLSNYKRFPERIDIGWMSNNSYVLEYKNDFTRLDDIANFICEKGEGGLINIKNIQKYGRYGEKNLDTATMCNPCLLEDTAILSKSRGLIKIKDAKVGELIYSAEGWTKLLAVYDNGFQDVYKYTTNAGVIYLTKEHEIIQEGIKVKIGCADAIDTLTYRFIDELHYNSNDIMDGLIIGDGACLKQSRVNYLYIGKNDQDYFSSEISHLIKNCVRPGKGMYKVVSSITREELPVTYERIIPDRFFYGDKNVVAGFLRGLYSANGDVSNDNKVGLRATSRLLLEQVQVMLSSLGIQSLIYKDKAKSVCFNSCEYLCRDSYKLRVTRDRDKFYKIIGFIQNYKNSKLYLSLKNKKRVLNIRKITFELKDKKFFSKSKVYDITVSNKSHTFWAAGFNVSNCGEIGLESRELCNLFEVYPSKAKSKKEFLEMCRLATIYATSVALLPTHDKQTNQVIAKNRRIGVSLSGVADWFDSWGSHIIKFMRSGYNEINEFAKHLNAEAGVVNPIRITTVKPSGSVSQLSGVSPGMHFPVHGPYALRRMRISNISPVVKLCRQAGLYIEPDVNNRDTTQVIEYPIYTGTTRSSHEVSAWEQFSLLALLQREWSDNMVSCTIHFTEEEKKDIPRMLAYFLPIIKSVSLLLKNDKMYPQMPYEKINETEYKQRMDKMKKINWSQFNGSDGKDSKFCSNDSCDIA